jgi:hypothetical protein
MDGMDDNAQELPPFAYSPASLQLLWPMSASPKQLLLATFITWLYYQQLCEQNG